MMRDDHSAKTREMRSAFAQIESSVRDDMLEAAFAAFYQTLTHSEHFRSYFTSQAQIDRLIEAQKADMKRALTLSETELVRHYDALGRLHVRLGVAYEDLLAGLTIIRDTFQAFEVMPTVTLYAWFETIERALAEGYFSGHLEDFLQDVEQLQTSLNVLMLDEQARTRLMQPLVWFERLAKCWHDGERKLGLAVIQTPQACPLHGLIDSLCADDSQRQILHRLHQRQHQLAIGVDYFLGEGQTVLATSALSHLFAVSMSLFNHMLAIEANLAAQQLKRDPLTGLLMRHDMEMTFARIQRQSAYQQRGLGVMMADIDHFKQINDTHGHQAGDAVLKAVAQEILSHLRDRDVAVRYGGEEFLLLISGIDAPHLCEVAERIRRGVETLKVTLEGTVIDPQISLGGVYVSPAFLDVPFLQLVNKADKCLYQAKQTGRNRVVCQVFEPLNASADAH